MQSDIGGAYSYPTTSDSGVHRKALQESVDKKLYFAGEATNTNGFSQTITGALLSGIRAAEEIMKNLN